MKIFDTVQALRPEVDPMPVAERRRVRETLFDVGHGDTTRTIRGRSESGAVVSTAPHGIPRPVRVRPKRSGSLVKMAAGLLVAGGLGAAAWSYTTRGDLEPDEMIETVSASTIATTTAPPPPSTAAPFVRTGVTSASPVVLPATLLTVEQVSINPASPENTAALLAAPDGASVWLAEVDGGESGSFGLDVRRIGAIDIGIDPTRDETSLTSYRPIVPCGFVLVNEGWFQPYDRPETLLLFESMSLDNLGRLDVDLPAGWSIIDIGPTRTSYETTFQLPGDDESVDLVTLRQIPDGSLAQLAGGGERLAPTTLLGGPAYLDVGPLDPNRTALFWRDDKTAFSVASSTLGPDELAGFIDDLEPATTDAWRQRFGLDAPAVAPITNECTPQPSFGNTLSP